jgi:hypothetical protein
MRTAMMLALVGLMLGSAALMGARAGSGDAYQYKVARVPANSIEVEIDSRWHVSHKEKQTVVTPLDYFGKEGWDLVSAVREPDGTYVCFFRKPK